MPFKSSRWMSNWKRALKIDIIDEKSAQTDFIFNFWISIVKNLIKWYPWNGITEFNCVRIYCFWFVSEEKACCCEDIFKLKFKVEDNWLLC